MPVATAAAAFVTTSVMYELPSATPSPDEHDRQQKHEARAAGPLRPVEGR